MSLEKNEGKREAGINFRSINYEIAILRNFFNYCIEKKYIDRNPCEGVKKLNELSRLKTLSDDDIAKLVVGATNKLTRGIIMFLIYTGCRKGEALDLKWDIYSFACFEKVRLFQQKNMWIWTTTLSPLRPPRRGMTVIYLFPPL